MPPRLPVRSLLSAAALRPCRVQAVRTLATPATGEEDSGPVDPTDMFMDAAPQGKVKSGAIIVKYAGMGAPITPGVRHTVHVRHPHLHKGKPFKALTLPRRRNGGRGRSGRVVVRGIGGGHKQRIRTVDWMRKESGEHKVIRIEYDPGRTAHIALVRDLKTIGLEQAAVKQAAAREKTGLWWGPQQYSSKQKKSYSTTHFGGYSYILAPENLRKGDIVTSFRSGIPQSMLRNKNTEIPQEISNDPLAPQTVNPPGAPTTSITRALGLIRTSTLKPGNVLPLWLIPPGTTIHAISLSPNGKLGICRSAGTHATVVSHGHQKPKGVDLMNSDNPFKMFDGRLDEHGYSVVRLKSGEIRKLHPSCAATIGTVSNREHQMVRYGKAGRVRWLGRRPKVRGMAMNACDHAHGGGRGKSKGNRHPMSVYGVIQGKRTRRPRDTNGNKMVLQERPRGRQAHQAAHTRTR